MIVLNKFLRAIHLGTITGVLIVDSCYLAHNARYGIYTGSPFNEIHVINSIIENHNDIGIRVAWSSSGDRLFTLTNSTLRSNNNYGFYSDNSGTTTVINTIIENHSITGLYTSSSAVTMKGSILRNHPSSWAANIRFTSNDMANLEDNLFEANST